jgi:hypothetical protein
MKDIIDNYIEVRQALHDAFGIKVVGESFVFKLNHEYCPYTYGYLRYSHNGYVGYFETSKLVETVDGYELYLVQDDIGTMFSAIFHSDNKIGELEYEIRHG